MEPIEYSVARISAASNVAVDVDVDVDVDVVAVVVVIVFE